jgi:hypothetical protein
MDFACRSTFPLDKMTWRIMRMLRNPSGLRQRYVAWMSQLVTVAA